jgi:hypothetical protein
MISIPIRTRVAADGTITLHAPPAFRNKEVEAYLVVHPVAEASSEENVMAWREELRALAGSITDETFERGEQGAYQEREEL